MGILLKLFLLKFLLIELVWFAMFVLPRLNLGGARTSRSGGSGLADFLKTLSGRDSLENVVKCATESNCALSSQCEVLEDPSKGSCGRAGLLSRVCCKQLKDTSPNRNVKRKKSPMASLLQSLLGGFGTGRDRQKAKQNVDNIVNSATPSPFLAALLGNRDIRAQA